MPENSPARFPSLPRFPPRLFGRHFYVAMGCNIVALSANLAFAYANRGGRNDVLLAINVLGALVSLSATYKVMWVVRRDMRAWSKIRQDYARVVAENAALLDLWIAATGGQHDEK